MIYDSILGTIGRTPIVRINRLAPQHVTMYVKCEFFNPLSSVKDRLAIAIVEAAERSGALQPGQTVVEATSGNTGIALAMVCAARGSGMVKRAEAFAAEHGAFLARQAENPANTAGHRNTTAAEILQDFAGRRLDYFVAGWGTGGTVAGAGRVLKAARPEIKVILSEPAPAPLVSSKIKQEVVCV